MKGYGKELILDLHDCDVSTFNRKSIENYFVKLCILIDMEREDRHFWDYEGDPEGYENAPSHLKGTSAVQFIKTSSMVIHTLDDLGRVYINIFSCKDFNGDAARDYTEEWFEGKAVNNQGKGCFIERI